jgi:membrane protein implicated in regulation of membrane protease activity
MAHREGFHYGPCSTTSGGVFRLLVLAGVISAVLFWPTVVAVATTVALIVKVTLVALTVVAVLAAAVAVAIAVRRRHSAPTASLVAVESDRNRRIEGQLAALTAAVERLERDRTPTLSASAHIVRLDPQTLALLTAMANSASQRLRALPERWDAR